MASVSVRLALLSCLFHLLSCAEPSFKCEKPGKFKDSDETRYHQCFFLYGKLTYHYNKCPANAKVKTCFSESPGYCASQACKDYVAPQYKCAGRKFTCIKEGVFAHPQDTSVYFKCFKHFKHLDDWELTCYTCSKKYKTCFSEKEQKCLPSSENCKTPKDTEVDKKASSLLYECDYFDFTCSELGPGYHPIPGDKSVYFECLPNKKGKLSGKCKVCKKRTCYSEKYEKCVKCKEETGVAPPAPPPTPYQCTPEKEDAFTCTKKGYFANPLDTSIYFYCSFEEGKWIVRCLTCNSKVKTCFSEKKQSCLKYFGKDNCPDISKLDKISDASVLETKDDSPTYDCEGYQMAFPCKGLEKTKLYGTPADPSVFFQCSDDGWGTCDVCDKSKQSCFDEIEGDCIDDCLKVPVQYDCESYDDFDCKEEGVFANKKDTSVYFVCIKKDGKLKSVCLACGQEPKSCFSEGKKTCVATTTDKPCGEKEDGGGGGGKELQSYTCPAFSQSSIDSLCEFYAISGVGKHVIAGDKTIYLDCSGNGNKCQACPKETKSCFIPGEKECVENCGKVKPYKCDRASYNCKSEGVFGHPEESSIFFKCTKNGNNYEAGCFICNNLHKTCFSEIAQACVDHEDLGRASTDACGAASLSHNNKTVSETKAIEQLTYDCAGYEVTDGIPKCGQLGSNKFPYPGDKSIYYSCKPTADADSDPDCSECKKDIQSCFVESEQDCIADCGKAVPYNCAYFVDNPFPCDKTGYFAHPKESSIYFNCIEINGKSECFTCLPKYCFNEDASAQTCLPNKQDDTKKCGLATNTVGPITKDDLTNSLTYDKSIYENNLTSFTCEGKEPGIYKIQGDKSVYFECSDDEENPGPKFTACSKELQSCFDDEKKICIPNCGAEIKGNPPSPYSCSSFDSRSYSCSSPGYFVHPNDFSIFFQCIKIDTGYLSFCYTCGKAENSQFSQIKQRCVDRLKSDGTELTESKPVIGSCAGYDLAPTICQDSSSPKMWSHPGDPTTYFKCAEASSKPSCYKCPLSTCFDDKSLSCSTTTCKEEVYKDLQGNKPFKQFDCTYYKKNSFTCSQEGLFANPTDTSVYFQCVLKDGVLTLLCFTCDSVAKTCFSEADKNCFKSTSLKCGTVDTTQFVKDGQTLTWSCNGYGPGSFPSCEELGGGHHPILGDESLFILCKSSTATAACQACPKSLCFDKTTRDCHERCELRGITSHDCSKYNKMPYNSFISNCKYQGIFPVKDDTSVYFKCVKIGSHWESYCYACNRKVKTCYSKKAARCLPLDDNKPCGNRDPVDSTDVKTDLEYKGYTCDGYEGSNNDNIFPCKIYGSGNFLLPGDRSVFINCDKNGLATCAPCLSQIDSCFEQNANKCVENCWGLKVGDYECDAHKFDCEGKQLGIYSQPDDTSIHHNCVMINGKIQPTCYTCSSLEGKKTCFNPDLRACMKTVKDEGCKGLANTAFNGSVEEARAYNCDGYKNINCKSTRPIYSMLGDRSVTFICEKDKPRVCTKCNDGTCFDYVEKKCNKAVCNAPNYSGDLTVDKCKSKWVPFCLYLGVKRA